MLPTPLSRLSLSSPAAHSQLLAKVFCASFAACHVGQWGKTLWPSELSHWDTCYLLKMAQQRHKTSWENKRQLPQKYLIIWCVQGSLSMLLVCANLPICIWANVHLCYGLLHPYVLPPCARWQRAHTLFRHSIMNLVTSVPQFQAITNLSKQSDGF